MVGSIPFLIKSRTLLQHQSNVAGNAAKRAICRAEPAARAEGCAVTMELLPTLASKAVATWRVVTKAIKEGDARFKVELTSDQFQRSINEDESTTQY